MSKGKSKVGGRTTAGGMPPQQQPQQPQQQAPQQIMTYDDFMKSDAHSYSDFLKLSEDERFSIMDSIVQDNNITVPNYLDSSSASKVIYALGMNDKPTVVTDAQLDAMSGRELFRTVYEKRWMPPPSSDAILDQIRKGDYTQLSDSGGSAHGRAIYFATDYHGSAVYGHGEKNALVMRAKIAPTAKIVQESTLRAQMNSKSGFSSRFMGQSYSRDKDATALYAVSQGIDGWYSGSYTMIVNRRALVSSSTTKTVRSGRGYATDWSTANKKK